MALDMRIDYITSTLKHKSQLYDNPLNIRVRAELRAEVTILNKIILRRRKWRKAKKKIRLISYITHDEPFLNVRRFHFFSTFLFPISASNAMAIVTPTYPLENQLSNSLVFSQSIRLENSFCFKCSIKQSARERLPITFFFQS